MYAHPAVRWLLGGELHPGGGASTRRALELIELGSDDVLLDVASGAGDSALLAAREHGCSVVGVEYGQSAVASARSAAREHGLDELVSFEAGDAEALPLADDSVDAVLCECSLCTFPDKDRAVAEIRRVLRRGGRVAISDVIVDRSRLPADLDTAIAAVGCVGAALDLDGYRELLRASELELTAVESRDQDAGELAARVHERLRAARMLGLGQLAGSPLELGKAVELVGLARGAIAEGTLGYSIMVASG